MRVLVDVDGVVADLMGGFEQFIRGKYSLELRPREITTFHIAKSPTHVGLHERIDLDSNLEEFLALPSVYQDFVHPVPGAVEAIPRLTAAGHEVGFVTATLHESPESYASKYRWLTRYFGRMPVISCPSGQKHWFAADYGIDDRGDTCERWRSAGVRALLFRQPWNEAPEGTPSYDWTQILDILGA
jgi:5'(3')-deoxyribonucleotidase